MGFTVALRRDSRVLRRFKELTSAPHYILRIVSLLLQFHRLLHRDLVLFQKNMRFNLLTAQIPIVARLIYDVAILRLQVHPCTQAILRGFKVSIFDHVIHLHLRKLLSAPRGRSIRWKVVAVITIVLTVSSSAIMFHLVHVLA